MVVEPGKSLSLQKHKLRNEYWIISSGTAIIKHGSDHKHLRTSVLEKHEEINIYTEEWHQLINNTSENLRIVEVQFGINCIEEDITRI